MLGTPLVRLGQTRVEQGNVPITMTHGDVAFWERKTRQMPVVWWSELLVLVQLRRGYPGLAVSVLVAKNRLSAAANVVA